MRHDAVRWRVALLAVVVLLVAACTPNGEESPDVVAEAPDTVARGTEPEPEPEPTGGATFEPPEGPDIGGPEDEGTGDEETGEPTGGPTEIATGAATDDPSPFAMPVRSLPAEWYVDTNGDAVPDFVETELGWDPAINECVAELDCEGLSPEGIDSLAPQQQSVLLILDSSGSMAEDVTDGQKIDLAKEAIGLYATGTPDTTDLGFMVYGHEGSADPADQQVSCEGVDLLAPLGEASFETLPATLEEFVPTGFTPIGRALEQAEDAFAGKQDGSNRVILVSDGLETCDGDPVAAARQLQEAGIAVQVDVIGFDVPSDESNALRAIAEAGGGRYVEAADGAALREGFIELLESQRSLLLAQSCVAREAGITSACMDRRAGLAGGELSRMLGLGGPTAGESWTSEQRDEIDATIDDVRAFYDKQLAALEEASGPVAEQLRQALDEAEERLRETYGEDVGFAAVAFCWDDRPPDLAAANL